ncbi:MAG: hypothetical protein ACLQUY_24845 [Ktedonobacterales bacterium]
MILWNLRRYLDALPYLEAAIIRDHGGHQRVDDEGYRTVRSGPRRRGA